MRSKKSFFSASIKNISREVDNTHKIAFGVMVGIMSSIACAGTLVFDSSQTIASNLVFASDSEISVASDAKVQALGTIALDGVLAKTGAGEFELQTSAINGKANGGESAALSVQGGVFGVSTPASVANTFSGGLTIGETGAFNLNDGVVTVGPLSLGGGMLNVSGGSLSAASATGAATVTVSGGAKLSVAGNFSATSVATERDGTRIDVTDGGVFAVKNMTAASGAEIVMHVDGGTLKSLQSATGDSVSGGTVYVGEKGMTIDVTDTYAWGPKWESAICPEPGVTDGGVDIISTADTTPDNPMRIRFMSTCELSVAGGIRVENAEVMLLGENYPVSFSIGDVAGVRAAISPTVTVNELSYSGDVGTLVVGVSADKSVVTLLTAKKFTPPVGQNVPLF